MEIWTAWHNACRDAAETVGGRPGGLIGRSPVRPCWRCSPRTRSTVEAGQPKVASMVAL
jgi:hypothetical protein